MAGWNDLPTELKARIVELIDENGIVRDGTAGPSSEERRALLALSEMERALYALTGPMLWETLMLDTRSLASIQAFAEAVSSQCARLVRSVDCRRPDVRDINSLKSAAQACSQALKLTPNVDELRLGGASSVWIDLLPSLPQLRSKVRTLDLDPALSSNFNAVDTADIRKCFDTLVDVTLPELLEDNDQVVVAHLQSIPSLQSVDLGAPYHGGIHDGNYLSLHRPWNSNLNSLSLSLVIDEATFRALLDQVGGTLEFLHVGNPPLPHTYPIIPFNVPVLERLGLVRLEEGGIALSFAFEKAPLESLYVASREYLKMEDLELLEVVMSQHKSTMMELEIRLGEGELEEEMLEVFQLLCEEREVRLELMWV